jgi:hypothetical protein
MVLVQKHWSSGQFCGMSRQFNACKNWIEAVVDPRWKPAPSWHICSGTVAYESAPGAMAEAGMPWTCLLWDLTGIKALGLPRPQQPSEPIVPRHGNSPSYRTSSSASRVSPLTRGIKDRPCATATTTANSANDRATMATRQDTRKGQGKKGWVLAQARPPCGFIPPSVPPRASKPIAPAAKYAKR